MKSEIRRSANRHCLTDDRRVSRGYPYHVKPTRGQNIRAPYPVPLLPAKQLKTQLMISPERVHQTKTLGIPDIRTGGNSMRTPRVSWTGTKFFPYRTLWSAPPGLAWTTWIRLHILVLLRPLYSDKNMVIAAFPSSSTSRLNAWQSGKMPPSSCTTPCIVVLPGTSYIILLHC